MPYQAKKYRYILFSLLSSLILFTHCVKAESNRDLINGKLATCPDKPNCISTESYDLPPIQIQNTHQPWLTLQSVITGLGGTLKKSGPDHLWATFDTSLLKFTDDVEARLDQKNKLIHLRSASRVGYYDFNTNKKRLIRIITLFSSKLNREKIKKTID